MEEEYDSYDDFKIYGGDDVESLWFEEARAHQMNGQQQERPCRSQELVSDSG